MESPYPNDVNEWDWDTVQSLTPEAESQYLEFKQSIVASDDDGKAKWRDKIEREIIAFANASGGILVFGVDDDGNAAPFERPEHELKQAVTRFIQNAKPLPKVIIPEAPIEAPSDGTDRVILPIRIEEAVRKPVLTHDSAVYIRLNDRKEPMSREQMESMFVAEDRRQQEIRQLEMEIQRFEDILDQDPESFCRLEEPMPPRFTPLNLESLKNALQNNAALYGDADLQEDISDVLRGIRAIERLDAGFKSEAEGYVDIPFDSKEDHWNVRRQDLRNELAGLHRALEVLALKSNLDVDFLPEFPYKTRLE